MGGLGVGLVVRVLRWEEGEGGLRRRRFVRWGEGSDFTGGAAFLF